MVLLKIRYSSGDYADAITLPLQGTFHHQRTGLGGEDEVPISLVNLLENGDIGQTEFILQRHENSNPTAPGGRAMRTEKNSGHLDPPPRR